MTTGEQQPRLTLRLAFIGMKGLPPDLPGAGGGERETDAKARRLAERGHQVTVYCRWNFVRHPQSPYHGVRLISLPAWPRAGLEMLTHTPLATLHVLMTDSADIISYHGMGNALFLPLAKLGGKRTVVYMDGLDWERPKWGAAARLLLRLGAAAAFRFADAVYVDNIATQQRLGTASGKFPEVITLAAETWEPPGDCHLSELGLEAENYILFVGMLRPDKGVHLLVDAYSRLETKVPLVIVGDNPDDPSYVQALRQRSDGRVKYLGYQYGLIARQLFAHCLIYVQPSVVEGNSPALMSAMACGRCVVVNGIDQNVETIGDAGIACKPGDIADMQTQLSSLLDDRPRIGRLGAEARRRIMAVYDWNAVVDRLEQLYYALA
jgi:glycosyltransferase involved in cell wall biosynthesis